MKSKKIFIISANPVKESFSESLALTYAKAAKKAKHKVRYANISDMKFNPVLEMGYKVIQKLEPDLLSFQENVKWADHLVFVYPNWWAAMPAKMKGLFDRAWLPGFAFKFVDGKMNRLLKGKTARIISICGDQQPLLFKLRIGDYTNELENAILKDCGVAPVRVTLIGPTRDSTDAKRAAWLQESRKLGAKGV